MSKHRRLWLPSLGVVALAILLGLVWPVSEGTCRARQGWIDYGHRTCFWPDQAQATRPLQHLYFGYLGLVVLLGAFVAGGVTLAQLVRRNLRRAP